MRAAAKLIRSYESKTLAEDYERLRPGYPLRIIDTIMKELKEFTPKNLQKQSFERMLDVACGTGQSTIVFKSYFQSILGIDISPAQISIANEKNKSDNIRYQIVNDNFFPVEDESMDLVTCASAAHFLHREIFTTECNRVLKPSGCAMVYTYCPRGLRKKCHINEDNTVYEDFSGGFYNIIMEFLKAVDGYHSNVLVMEKYVKVFEEIKNKTKREIETQPEYVKCTLADVVNFWSTLGEYRMFMEKNSATDPLQVMKNSVKKLLDVEEWKDEEIDLEMIYYYPMLIFQKEK